MSRAEILDQGALRTPEVRLIESAAAEPADAPVMETLTLPRSGLGAGGRQVASAARLVANMPAVLSAGALVIFDAAALLVAGYATTRLASENAALLPTLALLGLAQIVLLKAEGLYPGYGIFSEECLRRRVLVSGRVASLAVLGIMLYTGDWRFCAAAVGFLCFGAALQLLFRAIGQIVLRRFNLWGVRASLFARAEDEAAIQSFLSENWRLGISCTRAPARGRDGAERMALVAGSDIGDDEPRSFLRSFDEVVLLAAIPGVRGSGLRRGDLGGEIGLRLKFRGQGRAGRILTRTLDLGIICLTLPVVLPVILLSALAIYVVDPGPAFYRQTREGLGGRQFRMLKLRTMYQDADRRLEALLAEDEGARAEWNSHYKLRNDPRILPGIGRFLRMVSLDELPQLFNVLAGDMSLVGPRPFPLYHLDAMDPAFRARRSTVVPGITGLWQISGRSTADLQRQQDLDGFYIDNRSFWMDGQIIISTAAAVFSRNGAY